MSDKTNTIGRRLAQEWEQKRVAPALKRGGERASVS